MFVTTAIIEPLAQIAADFKMVYDLVCQFLIKSSVNDHIVEFQ